ncbi:SpoIIIAC/SpoIIIAD family protein, partial [Bacillus spizizenii]|uniref:SpoIIIAC/SpoIIIAD family protein n=1 Tax=Bacillus spizizenii TaxID=96241 RepID=UPI0024169111
MIATFLSLIVKEQKPTFAFLIVVFAGCAIFLYLVDQIYDIIRLIEKIAINANVNMVYVETIL